MMRWHNKTSAMALKCQAWVYHPAMACISRCLTEQALIAWLYVSLAWSAQDSTQSDWRCKRRILRQHRLPGYCCLQGSP